MLPVIESSRFECQKCGLCCKNFDKTNVVLTGKDLAIFGKIFHNVLDYVEFKDLKLSKHNMKATWIITDEGEGYLCLKHQSVDGAPCVFLMYDKCIIYQYRPVMCRMFPYDCNIEVVEDGNGRNMTMDITPRDFCIGVGKGNQISFIDLGKQAMDDFNASLDWKKFAAKWNKNPGSFKSMIDELIKRYTI